MYSGGTGVVYGFHYIPVPDLEKKTISSFVFVTLTVLKVFSTPGKVIRTLQLYKDFYIEIITLRQGNLFLSV